MGNYSDLIIIDEVQKYLLCHNAPCSKACKNGFDAASFISAFIVGDNNLSYDENLTSYRVNKDGKKVGYYITHYEKQTK